ncbi:hypothetical protein [Shouchella lehensis]|uniref:Uncharacterized protein n=1 Tax=Shouchella lehensis TaxID=300825 RepID=A0A4Y7WL89_9BACI|nr:hypothetical protein [Shouchella lehensis]MBG9783261.1 hypothetical protein [Shouchella lehensis]RQW22541.1 hypothetical protein EH196_01655 [Bacillus sp. C1-1]TES49365.1 hypothetical protein E2L03_07800 [Shouchella lehensis]
MTIMILIGAIFLLIFLLFLKPFLQMLEGHVLVDRLKTKKGFQSPLKAGILTFGLNVVLVSITVLCLYVPALIGMDMSPLFAMVFGTIMSVLAWGILNRGYQGNRPIMMGFIGSSFYLLAFITALIVWFLPSSRTGEELFHWEIGLIMIGVISFIAWVMNLTVISYRGKEEGG